ncbi:MAG: hypothetical protein WC861_04495 [Candidatus Micrarchaeia archaeon]|jgi:hypothetical protein
MVFLFQIQARQSAAQSFADYQAIALQKITGACLEGGAKAPKRIELDPSTKIVDANILGFSIQKDTYSALKFYVSPFKSDLHHGPHTVAVKTYQALLKLAETPGFEKYKPVGVSQKGIDGPNGKTEAVVFTIYFQPGVIQKQ